MEASLSPVTMASIRASIQQEPERHATPRNESPVPQLPVHRADMPCQGSDDLSPKATAIDEETLHSSNQAPSLRVLEKIYQILDDSGHKLNPKLMDRIYQVQKEILRILCETAQDTGASSPTPKMEAEIESEIELDSESDPGPGSYSDSLVRLVKVYYEGKLQSIYDRETRSHIYRADDDACKGYFIRYIENRCVSIGRSEQEPTSIYRSPKLGDC